MANYLETYKTSYNNFFKQEELNLKESLQKGLEQMRVYNTVFNKLHNSILEKEKVISSKLNEDYPKSTREFDNRKNIYSKDEVRLILKEEVLSAFIEENKNKDNGENNYSNFINELANRESLKYIKHRFYKNNDLYKYMYELDKLDLFKVDDLKINTDLAKLKKQLARELYGEPAASVESSIEAIQAKINQDEKLAKGKAEKRITPNKTKETKEIESELGIFEDHDKYILLNLCYRCIQFPTNQIPATEFARIMTITNGIYDNNIFNPSKARDLVYYKKINKGLKEITVRKLKKFELLDDLIQKLDGFNLPETIALLRSQKLELKRDKK